MTKALFMILLIGLSFCKRDEDFDAIGLNIAGPIDVSASNDGEYFYVLNADFDRSYDHGSILVIDSDGNKVNAVDTPRLGRSLTVAGTDMIVLFDEEEDDSKFQIQLYDLSNDASTPQFVKAWTSDDDELELNCTPINAVMRSGYQHFAVACRGGKTYIGTLADVRSESTLRLVRDYGRSRRAMFLDPNREILFAFPTDMNSQKTEDIQEVDKKTYDPETGNASDGANEVPDSFEDTRFHRQDAKLKRRRFRMAIYDIGAGREDDFPIMRIDNEEHEEDIQKELRWIYFTLTDADGSPDTASGFTDLDTKHYRTNFWAAVPDPFDNNAFYISHRGKLSKKNRFANSVIRVSYKGDVTDSDLLTSEVLDFQRVYGFSGELDPDNHFPSDIEVVGVQGRPTLLVNHFKDQVNFRGSAYFEVDSKVLGSQRRHTNISSTNPSNSYYQIALTSSGKALTCSFYSNAVIPLEVVPGTGINVGWNDMQRIE